MRFEEMSQTWLVSVEAHSPLLQKMSNFNQRAAGCHTKSARIILYCRDTAQIQATLLLLYQSESRGLEKRKSRRLEACSGEPVYIEIVW